MQQPHLEREELALERLRLRLRDELELLGIPTQIKRSNCRHLDSRNESELSPFFVSGKREGASPD